MKLKPIEWLSNSPNRFEAWPFGQRFCCFKLECCCHGDDWLWFVQADAYDRSGQIEVVDIAKGEAKSEKSAKKNAEKAYKAHLMTQFAS